MPAFETKRDWAKEPPPENLEELSIHELASLRDYQLAEAERKSRHAELYRIKKELTARLAAVSEEIAAIESR